jgi:hypothetical protein
MLEHPRKSTLQWRGALLPMLVVLSASLDLLTLFRNYAYMGLAAEANPFAARILATYGPIGISVAKLAGSALAIGSAILLLRLNHPGLAKALLIITVVLNGLGALSNLWV